MIGGRVEIGHFNAVRGRDRWKFKQVVVIAGCTLPPPSAVEAMAGAIMGVMPAESLGEGWWNRESIPLRAGGKIEGSTERFSHPDPVCEALRYAICEAETLQSIVRIRPSDRTAEDPGHVYLIGCPIPRTIEIDAVLAWKAPTTEEAQLALCGIALFSAPGMAKAYPMLWKDEKSAKNAKEGAARGGPLLLIETHNKRKRLTSTLNQHQLALVLYQIQGMGHRPVKALVDVRVCVNPEAWLADRLGQLSHFEYLDPAPDRGGDRMGPGWRDPQK